MLFIIQLGFQFDYRFWNQLLRELQVSFLVSIQLIEVCFESSRLTFLLPLTLNPEERDHKIIFDFFFFQ